MEVRNFKPSCLEARITKLENNGGGTTGTDPRLVTDAIINDSDMASIDKLDTTYLPSMFNLYNVIDNVILCTINNVDMCAVIEMSSRKVKDDSVYFTGIYYSEIECYTFGGEYTISVGAITRFTREKVG